MSRDQGSSSTKGKRGGKFPNLPIQNRQVRKLAATGVSTRKGRCPVNEQRPGRRKRVFAIVRSVPSLARRRDRRGTAAGRGGRRCGSGSGSIRGSSTGWRTLPGA